MTTRSIEPTELSEFVMPADGYCGDFALTFESYRSSGYSSEACEAARSRVYSYTRLLTAGAVGIEFDNMLQEGDEIREVWFSAYDKVRTAMMSGFHYGRLVTEGVLRG